VAATDPLRDAPMSARVAAFALAGHRCERLSPRAEMLASDDEHERRVTLLLLGKGAVLARWLVRPLAAEMDEGQVSRRIGR
jgi:hypothetical protein